MSGLNQDVLRHALSAARRHGFRTVKLRLGDEKFRAVLSENEAEIEESGFSIEDDLVAEPSALATEFEVTAPVVGYFRQGKQPLEPGRTVAVGEALCEIVALGIANDVVSKGAGEVVEVKVEPGDAVEFGQVLATVKLS